MTPIRERHIRRILVALDTSPYSLAALEAASELAMALHAELTGLFVEDADLLRLAHLPCARELLYAGQTEEVVDGRSMERALKAEAEQIRRSLQAVAGRKQLQWSFQVVRGQVEDQVLSAAEEADFVIMGQAGHRPGSRTRVGSTARAVMTRSSRTVAFMQPGSRLARPVVVLFDGAPGALSALETGARLAQKDHHNLVVLVDALSGGNTRDLHGQVTDWLDREGVEARIIESNARKPLDLARAVREAGGRVLVMGDDDPLCDVDSLEALFEGTGCPIVVAR